MKVVQIEKIASVPSFLERVTECYAGNTSVLFRGHQREDWELAPRLQRTAFRLRHSGSLPGTEAKMLAEFERLAVPFTAQHGPLSSWDRLALAQHHGLPTRLLDWSSNPLVALWFAVELPPADKTDGAVWAYETEESEFLTAEHDPFNLPKTMIFRPKHHDSRIIAQAGWFSVHKYLTDKERFSTLNRIESQRPSLRKFKVPHTYFPSIRDDLARCGINRATLFPDLSGLCSYLTWQFACLSDEHSYDVNVSL